MNDRYDYSGGAQGDRQPGGPHSAYPARGNPTGYVPSSGATAITAGVLAVVAGVSAAVGTVVSILIVADVSNDEHVPSDLPDIGGLIIVMFILLAALAGTVGLLYFLGALLLFARKTAGRVLVIIASIAGLPATFLGFGQVPNVSGIVALALCIATLALAALPSTGRWIAAGALCNVAGVVESPARPVAQTEGVPRLAGEKEGPLMKRNLNCPCGEQIVGTDEDDLVAKTQAHLAEKHPGHEYSRDQILFIAY